MDNLPQNITTKPIKDFDTATTLGSSQHLLGVADTTSNQGLKIAFSDLLQASVSTDALNTLGLGADGKLFNSSAINLYSSTTIYNEGVWVLDDQKLYRSLQDNNVGNPTSDTNYWEEIIIGASSGAVFSLFDFKWADHEINDISWVRGDTFSWQYGSFYEQAVQHLADDISGKGLVSETIGSTTIQYRLADDGHKICPAAQEANLTSLYNATGTAWYYLYDSANARFKLPRTKFGFTGLRDNVGKYIPEGLPNIKGQFTIIGGGSRSMSGAFYNAGTSGIAGPYDTYGDSGLIGFEAKRSNSIYGASTTVQQRANQMYLYFYIGKYSEPALLQTAGLNASLFNNKVDLDLGNSSVPHIIEVSDEELLPSSYRIYSDGYCQQSGVIATVPQNENLTIYLLKEFRNESYYITVPNGVSVVSQESSSFTIKSTEVISNCSWSASGYLKDGEYEE